MPSPPGSAEEPNGQERRFLIAAGTARYAQLPENAQLPSVQDDIRRLVDLFTRRLGYQLILPELGENPPSAALRVSLTFWLRDPDRRASDVIVFYYSGHGAVEGSKHYLLTSDSKERYFVSTALPTELLAEMLVETPIQQFLVLLDTCYSGKGAGDFSKTAAEIVGPLGSGKGLPSGMYVIAAARPKEEANQGVFSEVFVRAVENPTGPYAGNRQPFLLLDPLVNSINKEFQRRDLGQHAVLNSSRVESVPRFLKNVDCSEMPDGIDINSQRRLLHAQSQDLIIHWGPRARGVEIEAQPGWYFTGRTAALAELVRWLTDPQPDGKARVVTGSPGSGKSAVLSRLVTLSDPEYRKRVPLEGVPAETIPPEGAIDLAIHARHKTLENCLASIAAMAGIEATQPELLVDALARQGKRQVILLDALDEAIDPVEIARKLLRPLSQVSTVRLLVGTRRDLLTALGLSFVPLDLDHSKYINHADLAEYVRRRLLAEDDPTRATPYRGQGELAADVARVVGEKAYPIFLVARLISESLIEASKPVDTSRPEWREQFPSTVGDAFDDYLGRFGVDEQRVRDLLRPLAYAEGAGLPWENLWAPLASTISGESYT